MVKVEKHGKIEEVEKPMPTTYWMRTYKPSVDYLRDAPFALDRQLADQVHLQQLNRNPQLHVPTKMDKSRSQITQAPRHDVRAVAMKANALNKIVREASGVHNYTIVAPPRALSNEKNSAPELLDPETNPRVRAYATEAKQKPVLCSFGHRPRSASRTFHPATMAFRLPHGSVAPVVDARRSSVGLPVAVLKKVIKAPPIVDVIEEVKKKSASASPMGSPALSKPGSPNLNTPQFSDLFLSPKEQDSLFRFKRSGSMSSCSQGSSKRKLQPLHNRSQTSWVSTDDQVLDKAKDARPSWDEGFHRIQQPSNHVFQLRASGLQTKQSAPLGQLLHRFSSLSVAENQLHPFCTERQQLDKLARTGAPPAVPRSVAVKGQPLYTDPLDVEVAEVQRYRRALDKAAAYRKKVWDYKNDLRAIPDVDYYPTTQLAALREGQGQGQGQGQGGMQAYEADFPHWREMERDMKQSLARARKGDLHALYETTLARHQPAES